MSVRLYRCPPEFAGAERAEYVTKPLVRRTRHHELLAWSRAREPFWPRWHAVREGLLNGFLLAAPLALVLMVDYAATRPPAAGIIRLNIFSGIPWLFVAVATLGVLIPREVLRAMWGRDSACVLPYAGVLPIWSGDRLRERMQSLYLAGLDFRGFATLMSAQRAFLSRREVFRLRWLWPAFFASVCALDNLMKMLTVTRRAHFGLSVAVAALGFLCWFALFHMVLLPIRRGGGMWSVRWASYVVCAGWGERLRWALGTARDLGKWVLLLAAPFATYAALFAAARSGGWPWRFPVGWYIQPLATFAWLVVFARLRGPIERALAGGAYRSVRRRLRADEERFADFVRRLGERG